MRVVGSRATGVSTVCRILCILLVGAWQFGIGGESAPSAADPSTYLSEIARVLQTDWPKNRTITIVCHGRSNANAIKNAIRIANDFCKHKVNHVIESEFNKLGLTRTAGVS